MAARKSVSSTSPAVKLDIYDVEKVKGLSNYYLYVIQVTCKDGSHYFIRRRYRHFNDLHNALEKRFPIEAGSIKSKDRTLPMLPGKVIFGRSAVRNVTDRRLPLLNDYLRTLMSLPDKIRFDSIVTTFSKLSSDDQLSTVAPLSSTNGFSKPVKPDRPPPLKPAAPPKPTPPANKPNPRSFQPLSAAGPSTTKKAPPPRPTPPGPKVAKGPRGKALYSYTGQYSDELSFSVGVTISLIRRVDADWWEGLVDGKKGLVPTNYIKVIEQPVTRNLKDLVQSSDEWDSSDDEQTGKLTYYFNGAARTTDVELSIVQSPTIVTLLRAIQKHLHQNNIILNYKDRSGDLIQLVDNDDIELLKTDGIPPRKLTSDTSHAPWAIYVTLQGDHTPYSRDKLR